jgi:hypothetical protein
MKKIYTAFLLFSPVFNSVAQPCNDLFISEYIEGSSFNKIMEIYNPTAGSVDLSNYKLLTFFNGNDTTAISNQLILSGTLAAGQVFIIANSQADSTLGPLIDIYNSFVANWNGNDAVALVNLATLDTIDMIGVVGFDPGSSWTAGTGTTQDHTLVRNAAFQEGTSIWSQSSVQWDAYPQNDFSHLGSHTMDPCIIIPDPQVILSAITDTVMENDGFASVEVNIVNPNSNSTSVDVIVNGGSAVDGSDYNFSLQTVTFPPSSSVAIQVDIPLVNDVNIETPETIILSLTNATNSATAIGNANITILDDDPSQVLEPAIHWQLFPSVSHSGFFVKAAHHLEKIIITDAIGRQMMEADQVLNLFVDTNHWPAGYYRVVAVQNGFTSHSVFVKQ